MQPPSLQITAVLVGRRLVMVEDRVIVAHPFHILRQFRKRCRCRGGPVLVVAPLSSHFGWLMRDMVVGLLPQHDVFLLEWRDAADIPAALGRFGLDAVIGAIMDALHALGGRVSVIGVSQAPAPILAAVALMASQQDPRLPKAMVLMGGFIDPHVNPTVIGRLTAGLPDSWFTRSIARVVGPGRPGMGRRIYAAVDHSQALSRYLQRHLATQGELARKLAEDDGSDPERFPFLTLYETLMDLPAEFAQDNARKIFAEAQLARGTLTCRGYPVIPAAIRDVAVMTVEGGEDDSSGTGQTHAAHALCRGVPDPAHSSLDVPAAGHFGLFHGEPWRSDILPAVLDFLARHGGRDDCSGTP